MWLRSYSTSLYLFLYAPIALIVLFSFNAGRSALSFQCCSVQWFGRAFDNPFIMEALGTSTLIALCSATLATVFGTLAVFGLQRVGPRVRMLFDALTYCAIIIPGIVIGIATLIAFISLFEVMNPLLDLLLGRRPATAAHGPVHRDRRPFPVHHGAGDGHSPHPRRGPGQGPAGGLRRPLCAPLDTFLRVTLPQIAPAILAGFLLAFTFSFDDFIIAFFVAGSETTLPIYIFSSIRRGITPGDQRHLDGDHLRLPGAAVHLPPPAEPSQRRLSAHGAEPCVTSCTSTGNGSVPTWAATSTCWTPAMAT